MFSMFLYLVLYLQNILGYSPLEAGLRFLSISLLSFMVAPLAGKLAERWPVRGFLGAGLTLVGIGLLLMGGIDSRDGWTTLLPGFIVAGIGIGLPTLRSPPRRSEWSSRAAAAPPRGSTAPSARSASRSAPPALGALLQSRVTAKLGDALAGVQLSNGVDHHLGDAVVSEGPRRRGPERRRPARASPWSRPRAARSSTGSTRS